MSTRLTCTKVFRMIQDRLDTDNATILAASHLLVSEFGNLDDQTLGVYWEWLLRIALQRADFLQSDSTVARYVSL